MCARWLSVDLAGNLNPTFIDWDPLSGMLRRIPRIASGDSEVWATSAPKSDIEVNANLQTAGRLLTV